MYLHLQLAINEFESGRFINALYLFNVAGRVYGWDLVLENIRQCNKKLTENRATILGVDNYKHECCSFAILTDPGSTFLLHKQGTLALTPDEKEFVAAQMLVLRSSASEDLSVKKVPDVPRDWPSDLQLAPLPKSNNDWQWAAEYRFQSPFLQPSSREIGLSIVIPTYNRDEILLRTLACLVNQETEYPYEVIVADDGSHSPTEDAISDFVQRLDLTYVRQEDRGYRLCAVRNLGLSKAKYRFVAILDCDMAPCRVWVESYLKHLLQAEYVAVIGPRKYVDTTHLTADDFINNPTLIENLSEVLSPDTQGRKHVGKISVDWRLDHFKKTKDLMLCNEPFRFFSGGNVAFDHRWLDLAGWFDEEFNHWGGEDAEFAYRLYRAGCFFRVAWGALAYHQEPPGKENETDRSAGKLITDKIIRMKVPYFYRKITPLSESQLNVVPLVSIYIPAFNCEMSLVRCIESALNQTVVDLEVCVCNDGSTDNTQTILEGLYRDHPRVRFIKKANGGIAKASQLAVETCRGYYIGQVDSDDYLEPDAVETCLKEFMADRSLACVYGSYRNVTPEGYLINTGYNWPKFSREKFSTSMICHHFRMFTFRAFSLTTGFDESFKNAVDFDFFLKLSEIGPFKHINKVVYNRVLHTENTSIKNADLQRLNHVRAINNSLCRQKIYGYRYEDVVDESSKHKGDLRKINRIFVAQRNDGLGERLRAIINAMACAEIFGGEFKFCWQSNLKNNKWHSVKSADEIFSKDFIDKYHLSDPVRNDVKPINSFSAVSDVGAYACETSLLTPEFFGRFGSDTLKNYMASVRKSFESIKFSESIQIVINEAKSIQLAPNAVALHLRAGDIIFGNFTLNLSYVQKVVPLSIACDLIETLKKDHKQVILVGEDQSVLAYLRDHYDNVELASELEVRQLDQVEKSFFDMVLMGRCSCIYAGSSGFAAAASMLYGASLRSLESTYSVEQSSKISLNFLKNNCSNVTSTVAVINPEQIAFMCKSALSRFFQNYELADFWFLTETLKKNSGDSIIADFFVVIRGLSCGDLDHDLISTRADRLLSEQRSDFNEFLNANFSNDYQVNFMKRVLNIALQTDHFQSQPLHKFVETLRAPIDS